MSTSTDLPTLGVIIVTYNSSSVVLECLNSLLGSRYPHLKIVICDNASPDDTLEAIRQWSHGLVEMQRSGGTPPSSCRMADRTSFLECAAVDGEPDAPETLPAITLVRSGINRGYAGGVNIGLKLLRRHPEIGMYWILNPDCVVTPETASAFVDSARRNPGFGLMGGRIKYFGPEDQIQSDGGKLHPWTGVCANIGLGQRAQDRSGPDPSQIQFVNGASLVASRRFLDCAGPMVEDYFLYYEEVDWAFRRRDLPIVYAEGAIVYHRVGTSIGSATLKTAPSAFANYFNFRNRIRFMQRFYPLRLPVTYVYSALKIATLAARGDREEALAAFCGLFDLPPPRSVSGRLSADAAAMAFAGHRLHAPAATETP